jgi:hypothetical protein
MMHNSTSAQSGNLSKPSTSSKKTSSTNEREQSTIQTVLALGAPWPKLEEPSEQTKPKPKPAPKPKHVRKTPSTGTHITKDWQPDKPVGRQLAFSSDLLDIFAQARDEIASGKARGKIQNSGPNLRKHF